MWNFRKEIVFPTEVRNGKTIHLKEPKRKLMEDKIITDYELIQFLALMVTEKNVVLERIHDTEEEFQKELADSGRETRGEYTSGYAITWHTDADNIYTYCIEDMGADADWEQDEEEEYEDNEPETDNDSANQQLGRFGSIWNYLKGR